MSMVPSSSSPRTEEGTFRVLHVDDEPDFSELVSIYLERADDRFEVVTATSASMGLDQLSEQAYDCVISDYDMPGCNGIEFLAKVRENYPELPFVLFTGKGTEEIASDAISAGVTDYLQKQGCTDQYTVLANTVSNAIEHYRAQEYAEETRHRLLTIAEYTNDILWKFTADWDELLFINSPYEGIWGRSITELRERPQSFLKGLHPEDQDLVEDEMGQLSNGESVDIECRVNADEDFGRWIWVQGEPVFDAVGEVEKVVGFSRDITKRKEREQKLELVETLFAHAQECQFIIEVVDGEFKLRHANDYYKRTVGLSAGEPVTGQTPTELFGDTGGQEIIDRYKECVETRESVTYTVEVPVPEEGTVYRTILAPVVTGDEVSHIVGTARDITDHKRREEKLKRQNNRLEEFASVVSHDLRNPLRVADGQLELIREECESDHIDDVAQALDRMDALIEDLLILAREGVEVGKVESVVLADLIADCWQNIAAPDTEIVNTIDRTVRADRSRLQQLIENLMRNAVEHGGVDVTVTIGELEDGFYVEDDGPGITESERDDVFEGGYSTAAEGTGFGLSIVKQVAEAHDWTMRIAESSKGGARFELTGVQEG